MPWVKKHGGKTRWGLRSRDGKVMHLYTEMEFRKADGRIVWYGWQAPCGDTISDRDPLGSDDRAKQRHCLKCQAKNG